MKPLRVQFVSSKSGTGSQHTIEFQFARTTDATIINEIIVRSGMMLEGWLLNLLSKFVHKTGDKEFGDSTDRMLLILNSYMKAFYFGDIKPQIEYKSSGEYPELQTVAEAYKNNPEINVLAVQIHLASDKDNIVSKETLISSMFLNRNEPDDFVEFTKAI